MANGITNANVKGFSGDYNDLANAPDLAKVATSGKYSDITGTPDLADIAISGEYADLKNAPQIPTEAEDIGAALPSVVQSLTLTASGWSGAAQTLASGVITSATQPGDLFISQSATAEQFAAWAAAQPQVTGQAVGSITVTARGDVPAINIPVTLEVRS